MKDEVEITFDDSEVEYTVYVKDTQGNFHILKTHDQKIGSLTFSKVQGDYVIEEIYVQIQNNSGKEQEAEVSFKIKSKSFETLLFLFNLTLRHHHFDRKFLQRSLVLVFSFDFGISFDCGTCGIFHKIQEKTSYSRSCSK